MGARVYVVEMDVDGEGWVIVRDEGVGVSGS
jgi:hypothetical protein